MPGDVNFFLRSSPETLEVGLATANGNRVLDVKTGEFREVPGQIDPVLSPDGALLTMPETWVYNPKTKKLLTPDGARRLGLPGHEAFGVRFSLLHGRATEWIDPTRGQARETDYTEEKLRGMGVAYAAQYMSFYRRDPAFAGGWKPVGQDKDSQVVYQSVGLVARGAEGITYRVLVEGDDGLYTRDYTLGAGEELRFGPPAHAVCGGYHGTLPVIDKSGRELSSFDPVERATKVIEIGEGGGECTVKEKLPVFLGKADFSPDRRLIAFHSLAGPGSSTPPVPGRTKRLGVYVYDRAARALVPLPGALGEDSYFPVFLDDDRVAYLGATSRGANGRQKFHVNVASLARLPVRLCPGCYDGASREGQLSALLGLVSLRSCAKAAKAPFPEAMGAFGLLTRESCARLAASCGSACLRGAAAATAGPFAKPRKGRHEIWDGGRAGEAWDTTVVKTATRDELAALCRRIWQ